MEGVSVGPKERQRRLAKQRIDRSHRREDRQLGPRWTTGEKVVLFLSLALTVVAVILAVALFLL